MGFWDRVKRQIKKLNTTQEWVANKAGIGLGTFHGWIAKGVLPRVDQALAIAAALNTTLDGLLLDDQLKTHKSDLRLSIDKKLDQLTDSQLQATYAFLTTAFPDSQSGLGEIARHA